MKVFAISDLHMPGKSDKPMNVFGKIWDNYLEKIEEDWKRKVTDEDVVLLAGDLSWAMKLEDVDEDIAFLHALPGKKVLIKGNHDYWWQGIGKVRDFVPDDILLIQNDAIRINDLIVCGSRGWTTPNSSDYSKDDEKIYLRESERLELSLAVVDKMKTENDKVIAMMHYPPFNVKRESTNFTESFEKHGIKTVVYGHLHGSDSLAIKKVTRGNVNYYLTSCDLVGFSLQEIELK